MISAITNILRHSGRITVISGLTAIAYDYVWRIAEPTEIAAIERGVTCGAIRRLELGGVVWYELAPRHADYSGNGGPRVKRPADWKETRGRPRKGE